VAYFSEGARLPRGRGNFYYGARYYDPQISVWLSVDPLAGEAPYLTPYRFSFNNPLNVIDPNGMFETGYDLDKETGKLTLAEGENKDLGGDDYDVIIAEDGTQKIVEKGVINASNLDVAKTEPVDEKIVNFQMTLLDVSNLSITDGVDLFKWLSSKTDNEFAFTSFQRIRGEGDDYDPFLLRYISSSYQKSNPGAEVDFSQGYIISKMNGPYFLINAFHSHPTNGWSLEDALRPSGDKGDLGARRVYSNFNKSQAIKYGKYKSFFWKGYGYPKTRFRIYSPEHDKWNDF